MIYRITDVRSGTHTWTTDFEEAKQIAHDLTAICAFETMDSFMGRILGIIPSAKFSEDDEGCIVITTDMASSIYRARVSTEYVQQIR